MAGGGQREAETVGANHGAAVNDDAIADLDPLANRDVRINEGAPADRCLVANIGVCAQVGSITNLRARFHDDIGADRRQRFA